MKRIILLTLLVMAGTMIIWSQVPQAMNYKAIAKDDWGVSLPNKTITLRFSILQGSGTGSIVYQETHTTTTNKFGLMDVKIGLGKPEGGVSFTSIDWSAGVYYIRIEMDPKGGTDFRLEDPAHQLLSVPYALYAGSAAGSFSGYYSDLIGAPFLSTVATSGSYFDLSDRPTHLSQFGNDLSFLTIETDPLFSVHPANGITTEKISNWNTAFLWGNHANEGYLKSFTESDPIFLLHPAHGIASDNISNWSNAYSWGNHAGLYKPVDYFPEWDEITNKPTFASVATTGSYNDLTDKPITDGSETKITAGTNVTVTGEGTTTNPYSINSSGVGTTIPGNTPGDMQYWNGSGWVIVAAGNEGQMLSFVGGVPTWTTVVGVTIVGPTDVYNPTTGETWMDRNLGASQVATSSTDVASYGDLYQWGRGSDGHQSRTSGTTTTLSSSDTPGHANFILATSSPYDWRSPQNTNLWQGVSGVDNPCPSGYRLPTEAEWNAERLSWSTNNAAGAFASPLKLPLAGRRDVSNGSLLDVGSQGFYWSSTISSTDSRLLFFANITSMGYGYRAFGRSVRCIKDY